MKLFQYLAANIEVNVSKYITKRTFTGVVADWNNRVRSKTPRRFKSQAIPNFTPSNNVTYHDKTIRCRPFMAVETNSARGAEACLGYGLPERKKKTAGDPWYGVGRP